MFAARMKAAPDSLVGRMTRDGRRTGALLLFCGNLVWLFWMVAAPWFVGTPSAAVVWTTYLSVGLFLFLYQRAWFDHRARMPWYTIAIALLGLAIIPVNSSWSYIIYAGSLLPFWARGWRLVGLMTLLLASFYGVAMASGFFSPLVTVSCIVTTVVVALFNAIYDFNSARDAQLRLTQDEVRRLAIAAERERIGRDLHDLLGHTLSLVVIKTSLARRLIDVDPKAATVELCEVERVARQSLAEVREAVTGMRTTALAGELASARLMLEAADIALLLDTTDATLAPASEAALAFGLREAVTNVQRHAAATRVEVALTQDGDATELTVRDNGRGGVAAHGNGLAGMRERLAKLGGSLVLESPPGCGTVLRMRVPHGTGANAGAT
jgi:two-component system sensor histidine kinase DesK